MRSGSSSEVSRCMWVGFYRYQSIPSLHVCVGERVRGIRYRTLTPALSRKRAREECLFCRRACVLNWE